jgi:alanine racemase
MRRSWVEISLSRLRHNVGIVSRLTGGRPIIAVVKANAYGHGLSRMAQALWQCGVRDFAVAELEEAGEIRQLLPEAQILVLGGCEPGDESEFRALRLTAALFRDEIPPGVEVEIELETGMGRLGVPEAALPQLARRLGPCLKGVFSTLACSDQDPEFTQAQIRRFEAATAGMAVRRHLANSAGLKYPSALLDAVRPGLALYGIGNGPELAGLQPILTWKARVLAVNRLPAGATVGYGATWVAARASRLAVIGVGYADGYSRALSGRGQVLTHCGYAPVVGRVSMDLTVVDVTELPCIHPGDEVTLLDQASDSPISALGLAGQLNTIPYEVLTAIGSRVSRVYIE